jgi:hypothetical protein
MDSLRRLLRHSNPDHPRLNHHLKITGASQYSVRDCQTPSRCLRGLLPAWIDASTDSVHPTKASVDLIGNPKDSRLQMKWEGVKALFPIACRDTKKADGMKMHRHIFICCDNDDPHNEGLLLINVDWDENVDRSGAELGAVGKQLEHTETRVQLSECLQKARGMASVW